MLRERDGPGQSNFLPSTGTAARSLGRDSLKGHTLWHYVRYKQCANCSVAARNKSTNDAADTVHVRGPGACVPI